MANNPTYGDQLKFQRRLLREIEIEPKELAASYTFRRYTHAFGC
jgi:hypothetical protein